MHIDFDFLNPEYCLIGLQFMDYEALDPITNEVLERGKSLSFGFLFFTIALYF